MKLGFLVTSIFKLLLGDSFKNENHIMICLFVSFVVKQSIKFQCVFHEHEHQPDFIILIKKMNGYTLKIEWYNKDVFKQVIIDGYYSFIMKLESRY